MDANKNMSYAEAMQRLESIMNEIQEGKISLDDLSEVLKKADELVVFCRSRLYKVDEEVKALLQNITDDSLDGK